MVKFFDEDKHRRPLSLYEVLDFSRDNLDNISKDDFLEFHNEREFIPELLEQYKELSLKDLNRLKDGIEDNEDIIKKLKTYRNKYLAHDDIERIQVNISAEEIEELLSLIKEFIDFYYLKIDFSSNSYKELEQKCVKEIELIIDRLMS